MPPPTPKQQPQKSKNVSSIAQRARAAAELAKAASGDGAAGEKRVARFCESAWKLSVYVFLLLVGAWAIGREPWSRVLTAPPGSGRGGAGGSADSLLWLGWPLQRASPALSAYYLSEGAFYLASLFMLLHWEVKRADFAAMLVHHVATALLIAGSRALRFERVGSLVMALHDPSDVLLESAKLASYAGLERGAEVLFALLAGSWAALRLWALPARIMRSVALDAPRVLGGFPLGSRPLNAALFVLWCLHVYWFALICRVAWLQLTSGRLRDASESDVGGGGGNVEEEKSKRRRSTTTTLTTTTTRRRK